MPENNDILKKLEVLRDNKQFNVPEGYWEEFDHKVREKIASEDHLKTKNLIRTLRPQLALAASLAALFILSYSVFKILIPEKENETLSENEIYATLENELYDIDESTLYEYLKDNGTRQATYSDFELTEQEILDYLAEESSDMDLYLDEF